jgi:prolyl-tRNA editing enzyme YbaK/EbsC (Cys-tRNA(Pro) deacylase)
MPVYMERTILEEPTIYVNGGARGFLVGVSPRDVDRLLAPVLVDVAVGTSG